MTFGSPLLLSLFGLAAVVIALYVLKVKRRPVTVPYLRLWESLIAETRTRSLFKRLQRLFSLLIQLLILSAIVLALSDPSLDLRSSERESLIIVIDASASMQARVDGDGATRFERALEEAGRFIEDRSFEDEMMLIAAADEMTILSPFTRSTVRLREALTKAKVSSGSLDPDQLTSFVRDLTRDRERPVLWIVSDGAAGAIPTALDAFESSRWVRVGEDRDNVGIIRFSARKSDALSTDFVIARYKNYGETPQTFPVELHLNGKRQRVFERTLAPGEERLDRFSLSLDEGGTLELRLGLEDGLAADNAAFAIIPPNRPRRVVIVTPQADDAGPFALALESMAEIIAEQSGSFTFEEYARLRPIDRMADLTICLGQVPETLDGSTHLILIDTPVPSFLPADQIGEIERPEVWDWDRDHPLNRYLEYRDLPIPKARKLSLRGGTSVVSGFDGPLVSAFTLEDRRVVYLAFDVTEDLFPFRLAFPLLLRNAVAWFAAEDEVLLEPSYEVGEVISPLRRIDGPVVATYFESEERQSATIPVTDGRFYFAATASPGPVAFDIGERQFATAVNLLDGSESDLSVPDVESDTNATTDSGHFLDRELWSLLVAIALVLWAAEWGLYHRRITE